MNIIVHYPKDPENIRILKERVAVVHAQGITQYLENLTCPKEQKVQLIKDLMQTLRG